MYDEMNLFTIFLGTYAKAFLLAVKILLCILMVRLQGSHISDIVLKYMWRICWIIWAGSNMNQ